MPLETKHPKRDNQWNEKEASGDESGNGITNVSVFDDADVAMDLACAEAARTTLAEHGREGTRSGLKTRLRAHDSETDQVRPD